MSDDDHATVPFACGCQYLIPRNGGVWVDRKIELEVVCSTHGKNAKGAWGELIKKLAVTKPDRYLAGTKEGPKRVR